jgi:TonB-dependent receptor|tara:strand:- start:1695 stop:4298 length:2604 start_codon:yes stop_codon:yes gene_type:complete
MRLSKQRVLSIFILVFLSNPLNAQENPIDETDEAVVASDTSAANNSVEEIVVTGAIASLKSAIDKQRESARILSVVDSDALGNFPDTTAAESIRRLSGISIENDQGEGRYVSIRGMSSDLNSVAINGALMPAPEGNRSVMLDGLPTELLDSIEVSKSLTPDQDADSIGGRIDFKTKRPSELKDRLLKFKFDTQYNTQAKSEDNPRMAFTYGDLLSDNSGHVLGVTYSSKQIVTYNNETGYGWESNDEGLKEMNDDWEMRFYDLTRERVGLTYDYSYDVDDDTSYYFSALHNEYIDEELRYKDEYGKLGATGVTTADSMLTDRIRHDAETRFREETRTITALNFGGETLLGDWRTDYQLTYSFAEEDDSKNADITFRCEVRANKDSCINLKGNKDPVGQIVFASNTAPYLSTSYSQIYDPSKLEWKELELENSVIEDTEAAFAMNFEKDTIVSGNDAQVKFGIKYRSREVNVDKNKQFYEDPQERTLADFGPTTLGYWPFDGQTFSPQADPAMIYALRNQTGSLSLDDEETFVEDYVTEEDILSAYGMVSMEMDNALLTAGVRIERMTMDSNAYDQDGNPTMADEDHTFVSPSINYKFFIDDNSILRASLWRSLSRPSFNATAPVLELDINGTDISGSYGNPDLDPYESNNFDISYEYYGDNLSFFSIGAFLKQIDGAIYKTIQKNATINGISFNDGVTTWINADESDITGLELNFQQEFDGAWEGFYVALNLTFTDGDSTFSFEDDSTFTTPFRKLSDQQQNLSIGYDKGKFDIRLAMNYRDEYLDWLADEEDDIDTVSVENSRFVAPHRQWDLKAKYKYSDNLTFSFEITNINDRPEFYYWGYNDRLSQYDEYGTTYALGFTYKNN